MLFIINCRISKESFKLLHHDSTFYSLLLLISEIFPSFLSLVQKLFQISHNNFFLLFLLHCFIYSKIFSVNIKLWLYGLLCITYFLTLKYLCDNVLLMAPFWPLAWWLWEIGYENYFRKPLSKLKLFLAFFKWY